MKALSERTDPTRMLKASCFHAETKSHAKVKSHARVPQKSEATSKVKDHSYESCELSALMRINKIYVKEKHKLTKHALLGHAKTLFNYLPWPSPVVDGFG